MKKKIFLSLSLFSVFNLGQVTAQSEVGTLIQTGVENTKLLLRGYGSPITRSFGTDLNSGWVSTGEAFKPGRFELRVFANVTFIPDKDQTFDVRTLGLSSHVRVAPGQSPQSPTFFGEDKPGTQLDVYGTRGDNGQEEKLASFNLPGGSGYDLAPLPMAQLNLGLFKETELMVRFLPEIDFQENQVKLWGLGLKHNLNQWIPGGREWPFKITAAAAYTDFRSSAGLNVLPASGVSNPDPGDYSNQALVFNTQAYHGNLILAKTFWKRFNGYTGVSYSRSKTNAALDGTYPITILRSQPPYSKEILNLTYPLQMDFEDEQLGLMAGLRLKLSILTLNVQGTWAKYPSASAGIGLGWN